MMKEYKMPENASLLESLKNATSVWGVNTKDKYSVQLMAQGQAADFFRCKVVLPSQKTEEKEDGKILISAKISHEMEVLPIIMQWLPEIKIISPESLKKKMAERLMPVKEYIKEEFGL